MARELDLPVKIFTVTSMKSGCPTRGALYSSRVAMNQLVGKILARWNRWGYALKASWLKAQFFWNPIITVGFTFLFTGFHHFWRKWLVSLLITMIVSNSCYGAVAIFRQCEIFWGKRRKKAPFVVSYSMYYAISCFTMPFGLYLAFRIAGVVVPLFGIEWESPDPAAYRTGILIGGLIAGGFFLVRSRAEARAGKQAAEVRVKDLENENLKAQISALTAQMNPHLLFNALNTIASLVPTDPQKAEDTILQLSELYRGVLMSSHQSTHSLATELELCRAYLAIENARFGSRLGVTFEVEPDLDTEKILIPVLTVQPLVENAVKHGLSNLARGGKIRLSVHTEGTQVNVRVEDDGVGLGNSVQRGTGSGIANCRERLRLTYGQTGRLDIHSRPEGGTAAWLTLPVLHEGMT